MKKFFAALTMLSVFMISSVAMAAYVDKIEEGVNLFTIKKLAVAMPNYYKTEDAEPQLQDLIREIGNAGKLNSTREVVSYEEIAANIRRDTGVNIYSLDVPEAEKVYLKNVARYADAYVIMTVANNSKVPELFFYIYDAKNSSLMYTYKLQSRLTGKKTNDYVKAIGEFFVQLDDTTARNLDKEERKQIKEQQKEKREQKRREKKQDEENSRNKVDLVRKK
ncbi:MAG: YqzE family protein [Selenomonadaceae bacterium]|nr:YqzE family protein [Selenomonadaceae bacterium]